MIQIKEKLIDKNIKIVGRRKELTDLVLKNLSSSTFQSSFGLIAEYNDELGVLIYPQHGTIKNFNLGEFELIFDDGKIVSFYDFKGNKVTISKTNYYNHE